MAKVVVNTDENIVTVLSDGTTKIVKVTAVDQNRIIKVQTPGPKGEKGTDGAAFTGTLTGSLSVSGTILLDGNFSGSGQIIAQSFTGSLFGTASWASRAVTSSYVSGSVFTSANPALSASYSLSSSYSISGSHSITSSYALTASYVNPLYQDVIITGSLYVTQSHISTVDWIDFTTMVNPPHQEGRIHWIDDTKTIQVDTDVDGLMIELGHQHAVRIRNNSGSPISKGKIVYITGSQGNLPLIVTSSIESDRVSAGTLGMVAQTVNDNSNGYVITRGIIRGINTNAYIGGTPLYLSTSGDWSSTAPEAPLHEVRIGKIITQATQGTIYLDIMNGYEIEELHDVVDTNKQIGDLLVRSGSNVWKNTKQLTGSYGLTGSLSVSGSITATNLTGTASFATTSSYSLTSSYALNVPSGVGFPYTGSAQITGSLGVTGSISIVSGSLIGTSSNAITSSYALTASHALGYLPLTGGTINGDVILNGTASIAFLNVIYESSSVIISTGSNIFGDAANDSQTLYGAVSIPTGSLRISGSTLITGNLFVTSGITGSLFGTSSWAQNSITASFVSGAVYTSANPALSASNAVSASYTITASYSLSSSLAQTSSNIVGGYVSSFNTRQGAVTLQATDISGLGVGIISSSAFTSSWSNNSVTASYVTGAIFTSANPALSSSYALSASFARTTATASYVTGSIYTSTNPALSASYALTASYALNAGGGAGVGFPFSGSAQITGSLELTGSLYVSGTLYGDGSGLTNLPFGNTKKLIQTTPSTTWSFSHNLNEQYPTITVFDSNGDVVIPGRIEVVDDDNLKVYFNNATSGVVVAVVGGTAETASFVTASNVWGPFGSNSIFSSSYALTASYALNGGGGTGVGFPYTGSAGISGSLYVVGPANIISIPSYQSNDFFLIRNTTTTFKIASSSGVQITSSAEIPLQIAGQNSQSLFYVSQSGMIVLATSSVVLSEPAPNGGIYFTSTEFFVGLS